MNNENLPPGLTLDIMVSDLLEIDRVDWQNACIAANHSIEFGFCNDCKKFNDEPLRPKPYSTTWAAAGEVLDRYAVSLYAPNAEAEEYSIFDQWFASIRGLQDGVPSGRAFGTSGPHAICLAFVAYKQAENQPV